MTSHARRRSKIVRRFAARLAAAFAYAAPIGLAAQDSLVVRGHVGLRTARGERPVSRTWVTLHAIGSQQAGPVDSVITDARGRYVLRVAAESSLTYLATVTYGGIAHFARPARLGDVTGGGEIVVFDTTSTPVPLRTRGRHLVLAAPDATGSRSIVDVYEIENEAVTTRVMRRPDDATFVVTLPAQARNVRTGQGDFSSSSVRIGADQAAVTAPFPPGVRQLVLTYLLPLSAFPLIVEVGDATDVFEVLAEEEGSVVAGAGLESQGPVALEGRTFHRYLGRDVAKAGRVTISVPQAVRSTTASRSGVLLMLGGCIALGGLLLAARRPSAAPAPRARGPVLEQAIATVEACLADDALAHQHGALTDYRGRLAAERAELLATTARSS